MAVVKAASPERSARLNHILTGERGNSVSLKLSPGSGSFSLKLGMAIASVYLQASETSKFPSLRRSVKSRSRPNPTFSFSRVNLVKTKAYTV